MTEKPATCRDCGHDKADHRGFSGDYGNYHWHECSHGCEVFPYDGELHRFGGCRCYEFKPPLPWWRKVLARIGGRR